MQLKGLVRFFAIALILICLYQLSFTWFVKNHENAMEKKADQWVKRLPSPEVKYPGNKELQAAYADSLETIKKDRLKRLLDSTREEKLAFGLTTYSSAKEKELMLGLDLQGGMSVTMEVGFDGLIKSLANYTKDGLFNKALDNAVARKANTSANLIDLFREEYEKLNPSGKLAAFFATRSANKIKIDATNAAVVSYLKDQGDQAFETTYRILRTRIDRFGVASPNINPDPAKGIINIELAGVSDRERVRSYLQSTANLQFFEVYTLESPDLQNGLTAANKTIEDYLSGTTKKDTAAKPASDTTSTVKNVDTTKPATVSSLAGGTVSATVKKDSVNQNPIGRILQIAQPYQGTDGKTSYPGMLGYIATKDTGTLNGYFRMDIVKNKFPNNLVFMYGKAELGDDSKTKNVLSLYAVKTLDNGQAELGGEGISARQDFDERGRIAIKMNMDKTGTTIWARMTARNVGKPIAVVLDNFVYSAPNVNEAITTGSSQIAGSYSLKEAQDLSQILESGKLPAPAKIVQFQEVGPTLGRKAVVGGGLSFLISFIVIIALMLLYFNTAGWVANIALILNLLFTVGILSSLHSTLTAPGIAALVLTIGLAVDTNVIIFERIKEEISEGKSYQLAVNDGYRRSLAPVLDAHVTTLLTAIILFYFGLGPVLGFATTQIIGILLSLFCGILVSRLISDWYTNKNRHFEYFTGISKRIFKHATFKFIEYRKYAYVLSGIILIAGISTYWNGFDEGVEFSGGRSYTIRFDKNVNPDEIRDELKAELGETPIVKTVDSKSQVSITTSYLIHETGGNVDSTVEKKVFAGLKKHLPANLSFEDFDKNYKQGSQTVLPTISDDLKKGARNAVIFGILAICLYIFIRFRDWRYSVGTIVTLLHDVLVTLIVFSYCRNIVPFPLEIDQHFIAAVLTVIGFSMNDTVIVYDRIREDSRLMRGTANNNAVIVNRAINETLSRTIMTSLTVFLTILILFIFGGEVTRGFSFAMLIGVLTGTYSSIFVGAPILVDFGRNRILGMNEEKKK